jgi:methylamine dehydrogenase accessory protein MauD
MTALTISNAVLWLVVLLLAAAVLALARQLGVLHERIAPAGALMMRRGLAVGEAVPVLEVADLEGQAHQVGSARADGRSTLLLFVSPGCPVCKSLLPAVKSSRKDERSWVDVILASDGDSAEQRAFVAAHGLEGIPYIVSAALGLAYQVSRLPFAALLDERGILRARGLVNSREHLESLFEAAVWAVIEEYEARARREEELWDTLSEAEAARRLDELLLPVGRATGSLMNLLVKEAGARRILEVGSSYGYSTTWLAEAARVIGGKVISLELRAAKTEYARAQLARAGLDGHVEFRIGDALASLAQLPGPFDFVLIDLWKDLYVPVFERLHMKLAPGALVVADNMLQPESARVHASAYRARVRATAEMSSVLLTVGNGLELSRYR